MNLFENEIINILPYDGIVNYYGKLMPSNKASEYFNELLQSIHWENDQAIIYGKLIVTKRKVAWYGNESFNYTYSNITKQALPWTNTLHELKNLVEEKSGETFNSCLLNLYHNGNEGMAWHSDGEKNLKKNGAITSLSFGAERKFSFKHKTTKQRISLTLEHGSLLIMKNETQHFWQHRLPPTKLISTPRISLTFRTIVL
jgi:alkylated DNA repair dioxygenase AlkB